MADSFSTNDLKTTILVFALRDGKKEYTLALTKSAGLIKKLEDKNLHQLLYNKSFAKIWTILKD